MPHSADCPEGRSQHFTFSRRGLLQGLAAVGLPFVIPRVQSTATSSNKRPLPEFVIGDLVAQDWIDEFDKEAVDFGEVLGVRYLPEKYCVYPANSWLYYIHWTHTTCGLDYLYPCYDGEPTAGNTLRLVSHV